MRERFFALFTTATDRVSILYPLAENKLTKDDNSSEKDIDDLSSATLPHPTASVLPEDRGVIQQIEYGDRIGKIVPEGKNLPGGKLDEENNDTEISEKPVEIIPPAETSTHDPATIPKTHGENQIKDQNSDKSPSNNGDQVEATGLDDTSWGKAVKELSRHKGKKYNFGALLRDVGNQSIDNQQLILQFKHSSLMDKMEEELQYKENEIKVIDILKQYWQEVGSLVLKGPPEGSTVRSNKASPLIQAALGLGGRIITHKETNPDSE